MRYLLPIWGTCGTTNFGRVITLNNKILKILFKLDYFTNVDDVNRTLNIQHLKILLKVEQCKLIYKVLNKKQKSNLKVTFCNEIHSYNIRNCNDISKQCKRTNVALHDPFNESIQTYNSVPDAIKSENNYNKFIISIKRHFFVEY